MISALPTIAWLLDYEIRLATRYRRFLSFVRIATDSGCDGLSRILFETIRSSDVCFPEEDGISVVMGETGGADAIQAIHRYKRTLNGSIVAHFALASFPKDGKTASELMAAAQARLDHAKRLGRGALVAEG